MTGNDLQKEVLFIVFHKLDPRRHCKNSCRSAWLYPRFFLTNVFSFFARIFKQNIMSVMTTIPQLVFIFDILYTARDSWPDSTKIIGDAPSHQLCCGWQLPSKRGVLHILSRWVSELVSESVTIEFPSEPNFDPIFPGDTYRLFSEYLSSSTFAPDKH